MLERFEKSSNSKAIALKPRCVLSQKELLALLLTFSLIAILSFPNFSYSQQLTMCGGGTGGLPTPWTRTGSDIYYNTGRVGVKTATPGADLHVNGSLRFQTMSSCGRLSTNPAGDVVCSSYADGDITDVLAGSGISVTNQTGPQPTVAIATGGVTSTHIADGTIAAADLADNSVTSSKIADSNVTSAKIADANVTTAKLADNSVNGAKIALGSDVQGDVMYYNGTDWARLSAGTSGQFLQTQGGGANPAWATVVTTEDDPQVGANTTNYLSKWDGSALIASAIFESGGNVGIGTNNPSALLDVDGVAAVKTLTLRDTLGAGSGFDFSAYGDAAVLRGNTAAGESTFALANKDGDEDQSLFMYFATKFNPNDLLNTVDSEGMNIGYYGPSHIFTIQSQASGAGVLRPIQIATEDNWGQVFLKADGNVGINNLDPAYSLDITGTAQADRLILKSNDGPNKYAFGTDGVWGAGMANLTPGETTMFSIGLINSDAANDVRLEIQPRSNDDWEKLEVGFDSANTRYLIESNSHDGATNYPITLQVAGYNSQLFLNNDGNVGINQPTPGAKLDVLGSVRFSSINNGGAGCGKLFTDSDGDVSCGDDEGTTYTVGGESYLSLDGTTILAGAVNLSNTNVTGTLKGASFPVLTGAITTPGGSLATTLANDAVTSAKIADGTVALADLASNSVDTNKIVNGTIVAADIATDTITANEIAANGVGTSEIANNAVTTAKIADNNVNGAKIALGSDAQGDVMYYNGTDWARLGAGTSGYFLKTNGAGANPAWAAALTSESDPEVGANTTSYVPRWNGSALVTGTIQDNATNVGIGGAPSSYKLDVSGNLNVSGGSGSSKISTTNGEVNILNGHSWGNILPASTFIMGITALADMPAGLGIRRNTSTVDWAIYENTDDSLNIAMDTNTGLPNPPGAGGKNVLTILYAGGQTASSGNVGIDQTSPAYKLDVNGAIRSGSTTTNGQLRIQAGAAAGDYTAIINPSSSMGGDVTFTLPASAGTNGQVLTTNGSGTLSWTTAAGGGDLLAANNLSDVASAATSRTNLGLAIGTNVQAYDATLTSVAAIAGVQGDLMYASGADSWTRLAKDTNATRYLSNTGASNNPAWAQINLANGTTGTLPVASGGTGQTSYTNGQLLIGNTTGNTLTKATLTGTANQVNVTNGSGSITLSTPQNIHTGASPTFAGMTLTSDLGFSTPGLNGMRNILVNTTDGSDNASLCANAGGACANTRGAYIWSFGNEFTGFGLGGALLISAGNVSTGDIQFQTGGSTPMIIKNSGFVGVGNTAPDTTFHVTSNATSLPSMIVNGNTSAALNNYGRRATLRIHNTLSSGGVSDKDANLELMNNAGNFTVQTQTDGTFRINDNTAGVNRILMDSTGRVGIGTLTPQNTLHVNGTVRIATLTGGVGYSNTLCYNASNVLGLCSSSRRYKENIENYAKGMEVVEKLNPVTYDWKDGQGHDIGLIAEDVDAVEELFAVKKDGVIEGVRYDRIITVLINGLKELSQKLNDHDSELEEVKNNLAAEQLRNNKLAEEVEQLKADMAAVKAQLANQ
jgi:hypothetical protein